MSPLLNPFFTDKTDASAELGFAYSERKPLTEPDTCGPKIDKLIKRQDF